MAKSKGYVAETLVWVRLIVYSFLSGSGGQPVRKDIVKPNDRPIGANRLWIWICVIMTRP